MSWVKRFRMEGSGHEDVGLEVGKQAGELARLKDIRDINRIRIS